MAECLEACDEARADGYRAGQEQALKWATTESVALGWWTVEEGDGFPAVAVMDLEDALTRLRTGGTLEQKPEEEGCPSCHIIGGHVVGCCFDVEAEAADRARMEIDFPACPRCQEPGFNGVLCDKCGCKNLNPEESDG